MYVAVISCCWLLTSAFAVSVPESDTYRAATVMHTPLNLTYGVPIDVIIGSNLAAYEGYAQTAAGSGADILLLPESGTGFLQVPLQYLRLFCEPVPAIGWRAPVCNGSYQADHPHASWASCAAAKYRIDVVVNYCENVTADKAYNVDVCFTLDGVLRAVYRKSHITGTGPVLSQPTTPDAVTFASSFGVTFGIFTCYDFWFLEPMNMENVTDFLFPSEMASLVPFATLPQAQNGWSLHHRVNLIASTSFGNGGAGSYHAGTPVILNPLQPGNMTNAHSVVVSTVPKRIPLLTTGTDAPPPTVVLHGQPTTCQYGPNINGLNFSFGCTAFTPSPNATFHLHARWSDAFGSAACEANVVTTSASAHMWFLGAMSTTLVPSVATPSAVGNVMCMVFRCDTPSVGCMSADPTANWGTDLSVSSVRVSATFGKNFTVSNTSPYPVLGLGVLPLGADEVSYTPPEGALLNRYVIQSSAAMAPRMKTEFLFSAGIWATASVNGD